MTQCDILLRLGHNVLELLPNVLFLSLFFSLACSLALVLSTHSGSLQLPWLPWGCHVERPCGETTEREKPKEASCSTLPPPAAICVSTAPILLAE